MAAAIGLNACQGSSATPTHAPSPGSVATVSATEAGPAPIRTQPSIVAPELNQSPTPAPTVVPVEVLAPAYRVGREEKPGSRGLYKITGWGAGLRSPDYCEGAYRWIDGRRLLLFPLAAMQSADMGTAQLTWPLVVDIEDGHIWPVPADSAADGCRSVAWSPALQGLVTTRGGEILVLDLESQVTRRYPGGQSPLHISPSGRYLIAGQNDGSVWYDLESGRKLDLASWQILDFELAAWSADENRVFSCCFKNLDASTGEYYSTWNMSGLFLGGMGVPNGSLLTTGWWVLDSSRFMPRQGLLLSGDAPGDTLITLIDPAKQDCQDVLTLANLGKYVSGLAIYSAPSPDGNLIFATLRPDLKTESGPGYLIDLRTFAAQRVAGSDPLQPGDWSPDGRFILLHGPGNIYGYVAVAGSPTVQLLGSGPVRQATWAPVGSRLAYLVQDGRTLVVLDPGSEGSEQTIKLPVAASQILWSGDGVSLALPAEDGSLWWLRDAGAGQVEKLVEPLPGLQNVRWSPDGRRIAFVSGPDVYVVTPADSVAPN